MDHLGQVPASERDGPSAPSGNEGASPLSESIGRDLAALESVISAEIADRTKLRRFIQRLRSAWSKADGSAERLLKDPAIGRLRAQYAQADHLIGYVATDVNRQRARRTAELERAIRAFCTEVKQACQGRFPRLTVAHYVEVSIDEPAGRAKVGTKSVQSLDWSKIRPALMDEISRVWGRPFDAKLFRDNLLSLYEPLNARSQSPTGYVRLFDLFKELRTGKAAANPSSRSGGRLSSYYRDEFSADLSKLWRSQLDGVLPGTHVDFTSIRRAEEGFSIVLPSGDIATWGYMKPKS